MADQNSKMMIDEDEIDIREVFRTIFYYKYMIILLVMLFGLLSSYYAYFKPNIYKASATVEVGLDRYGGGRSGQDMLSRATDPGSLNSATEMYIVRSRNLSERILKKVDFSHRYYTTRRFKEVELYKNSPFQVGMNKGYGISFDLYPVDEKRYRLVVADAKDKNQVKWSYDKIHFYDQEIVTEHFHLNVVKLKEPTEDAYRFVVLNPTNIASMVKGGVSVSQPSKYSTILEISYSDNVALRAQEAANALVQAYLDQSIEKKTKEASLKLSFVEKQLNRITENLKSSAIKLEDFKRSANTINLSAKSEKIIRHMSEDEAKLEEISIQKEMLSTLYKQVESGRSIESIVSVGTKEESALSGMIKQLQEAMLKKKLLREDYTELYPQVRKITKTIKQLKKLMVSTLKNLIERSNEEKALLKKSISKQQKLLNTLPADERMLGQLHRKFAVNEKIYSYLLEKRSETAIIKASTVSKNRIIDTALLPGAPIKPKRKLIIFIGLALGLILGIALAFLRAFLDDRIKSEEDISHATDVPLLGIIPHIKEDKGKIKVFVAPKSAVSESFRSLRTNLQFMQIKGKSHVIALTSTIGSEGKTTACINLGAIMSIAGKRTIILNLDMRKPTLHEKFGLSNKAGMSTILSGAISLGKVIQHTEYENLDIVTSGPVPPNPSELIQSKFMEKILEKLREVYDVILIDTPPVGLVTDARTLMHFADTNIYLLRADYSKKTFLRSINKFKQEDIGGLGILLNDVKVSNSGYGYEYGYGYGYGYYEDDKH